MTHEEFCKRLLKAFRAVSEECGYGLDEQGIREMVSGAGRIALAIARIADHEVTGIAVRTKDSAVEVHVVKGDVNPEFYQIILSEEKPH